MQIGLTVKDTDSPPGAYTLVLVGTAEECMVEATGFSPSSTGAEEIAVLLRTVAINIEHALQLDTVAVTPSPEPEPKRQRFNPQPVQRRTQ